MVSLELFADRSSVGQASKLAPMAADMKPEEGLVPHSNVLQLGSLGALVVLGVLGGAGTAQAAVRRGAHCPAVNQLQVALGDRGYDVGAVDGKFGGRTEAAVRRFQKQQKLSADGIVGPATARAMGLPPEFSCSFVAAKAVQEPVVPQSGTFSVATNGGALRLRRAPAGSVVGAVNNGTSVTVIETADGWAKLRSGGWVSRAWLRVGGTAQAQQPIREAANPTPSTSVASGLSTEAVAPRQTTVLTAIPGQVIQLPSKQEIAQAASPKPVAVPAPAPTEVAVPVEVTAAPPQAGKIAITLPQAQPIVQSDLNASEQLRAKSIAGQTASESELRNQENAVIGTVTAAALSSSPGSTAVKAPEPRLVDSSSAQSLGIRTQETDSRAVLVAAVSEPVAAPQAIAPESTTAEKAALPQVADSAQGETSLSRVVPDSKAVELEMTEIKPAESDLEPEVVAVRSSQQYLEVATYGDRLLVRDAPKGQVIGSVANGVKVNTVDETDGWYELESGGWVLARWLRR